MNGYIVVEWRGDGRYHARDAAGCKVYKRESAAQRVADGFNNDPGIRQRLYTTESAGYVVRSMFLTDGVTIDAKGIIRVDGDLPTQTVLVHPESLAKA